MTLTVTATARTDAAPCPRVEVLIDDLDEDVATITLYRVAEGRTWRARGAVSASVSTGFQVVDVEAPFQTEMQYRAEMFDVDGISLGYTPTATVTLDVATTWVHNPLDPWNAVEIDLADSSGKALTRPVNGQRYYPEQRPLAVFITGRRLGLQGVELFMSTDSASIATKFESMIGGYENQSVPVLCVRTPPLIDIPRTFFAGVLSPKAVPVNVHLGGTLRRWELVADEAEPPFPGIIVPLLTRDDIDAAFDTRDEMDAAYATRLDIDRDFSKAGGGE
ncbi:hypothetical protein IT882_04400 [Microbacterium schleiferi]|uniref:Uncharacterized protein n=1 Tax=Microbacterium schleiferi TaxID=69362 RepID=A0A7S8MY49_9MICO|nr:hypothetical protein [Microbacterium schleiferi]QPE05315.1 hypothetical protein IT882_04400 [Microbacterium schleiferi]